MSNKIVAAYVVWDNVKPKTFIESILLTTSGRFDGVLASIGSLLPLGRNHAIRDVYSQCPDFTHLLFIDADMGGITPDIIDSLIEANRDVITPVMTHRQPPFSPVCDKEHYDALMGELRKEQHNRKPFEVLSTGFGCALIKREVLDAIEEKTDDGSRLWFACDRMPRLDFWKEINSELLNLPLKEFPENYTTKDILEEVYKSGVKKGLEAHLGSIIYGEDYSFCARARLKGFKIWMHGGAYIHHIGDQEYNLNDFLDFLKLSQEGGKLESRLQSSKVSVWRKGDKKLMEITHGE